MSDSTTTKKTAAKKAAAKPKADPPVSRETPTETWAEKIARLRTRPPAEAWVTIPDGEALQAIEKARQEYLGVRASVRDELPDAGSLSVVETAAFLDDHEDVSAARDRVQEAVAAAERAEVTFHFRQLPPDVYDALHAAHAASEAEQEKGRMIDVLTYVPALISACSVDPITPDEVAALIHSGPGGEHPPFNSGERDSLLQACVDVNERPRFYLGKGSRPTPD